MANWKTINGKKVNIGANNHHSHGKDERFHVKKKSFDKIVDEVKLKPIGSISGETRKDAEEKVGSKIESHHGNMYEFENGEEWLIFNNESDARKEALEYMENLYDDIGIDGWNKDWVDNLDVMDMSETDIRLWASEDGDRFVEDRDANEILDMAEDFDIELPKEYDDKENEIYSDDQIEDIRQQVAEARSDYVKDILKNRGLRYYVVEEEGLTRDEDFMEEYGKWLHVDKDRLFNASIDEDGIAHTLAGYDGKEVELPNGKLMYRHN